MRERERDVILSQFTPYNFSTTALEIYFYETITLNTC